MLESNMYAASVVAARPRAKSPLTNEATQTSSGPSTASVIMLPSKELSSHSAAVMPNSATSENQRKFAGPCLTQYTGTMTATMAVNSTANASVTGSALVGSPVPAEAAAVSTKLRPKTTRAARGSIEARELNDLPTMFNQLDRTRERRARVGL